MRGSAQLYIPEVLCSSKELTGPNEGSDCRDKRSCIVQGQLSKLQETWGSVRLTTGSISLHPNSDDKLLRKY